MKKRVLFGLFAFLLLNIFIIYGVEADTITGKVTSQPINVSIFVLPSYPVLQILKPENETYLRNYSLLLNFSASNYQSIWYNLDNGNNITITSPTYFNASDGQHTLYLFANSTTGLITQKNVTFVVNSTRLIIIYSEYNKSIQTTDFYSYSYEDLQELLSAMLHNEYGKISFNEVIDVIADENPFDNIVDFDASTNISFNRIEVNITAMPNLNKSAMLYLYNLSFINPRILRDGEICPSSICKIISYSSGTLIFNVTGFSVYSAEETPVEELAKPTVKKPEEISFIIDKEIIEVDVFRNEVKKEFITITNKGTKDISINLDAGHLNKLIKFEESSFILKAGEEKKVLIEILAKDELPYLYSGKIIVKANEIKKEIKIAINVKEKLPFLEILVNIPKKTITKEEQLEANIAITKKDALESEVEIIYYIKDFDNKTYLSQEEKIFFIDKISFTKRLDLPREMLPDFYILQVETRLKDKISSDSEIFLVIEKEKPLPRNYWCLALILLVLLIVILLFVKKKKQHRIEIGEIEKRIKRTKL
ncbi:MAG: hypothetical protein QXF25_00020 [Candidatus Pacearchaeota archaeon]